MQMLDWFIKEQGEEEKNAADLITKMELFGGDSKGLYMLNSELKARPIPRPCAGAVSPARLRAFGSSKRQTAQVPAFSSTRRLEETASDFSPSVTSQKIRRGEYGYLSGRPVLCKGHALRVIMPCLSKTARPQISAVSLPAIPVCTGSPFCKDITWEQFKEAVAWCNG